MNRNTYEPDSQITSLLGLLRRRVRLYVLGEGVATLLFHFGCLFWVTLLADRFFEPSVNVRIIVWGIVLLLGAYDAWFILLRHLFVRLGDRSMALVLERRFPQLNDRLLTAISILSSDAKDLLRGIEGVDTVGDEDTDFSEMALQRVMYEKTVRETLELLPTLSLNSVFNYKPLIKALFLAVLLIASVGVLYSKSPETLQIYGRRVFYLGQERWPRSVSLHIEGFKNGKMRVARGSDVEIRVRADRHAPKVPSSVNLYYSTVEAGRNRVTMIREGSLEQTSGEDQRWLDFTHTFRGLLSSVKLDIYAADASLRGLEIEVVESPHAGNMRVEVTYPEYMALKSRTLGVSGVMTVPAGSFLKVHASANKPLESVELVRMVDGEKSAPVLFKPNANKKETFTWDVGRFTEDQTLFFTLKDEDGITSKIPARLILAREDDQIPGVATSLYGIGSAVTPNAKIPVTGVITDDYGLKRSAFLYRVIKGGADETAVASGEAPVAADIPPQEKMMLEFNGNPTEVKLNPTHDFLELEPLKLKVKDQLMIGIKVQDWYNLDGTFVPVTDPGKMPDHFGQSQMVTLEVVTPERLRLLLEAREVVLRQLYEAALKEVQDSRASLGEITFNELETADSASEKEVVTAEENADKKTQAEIELTEKHHWALRSYRVERVVQNNRKNAHELIGVAEGIENICQQMKNNKIDTQEWFERLDDAIRKPLMKVSTQRFPELELTLVKLRRALDRYELDNAKKLHAQSILEMDSILKEMDAILAKMGEMQDFSEMVERLRAIIRMQEAVQEKTKKEHNRGLKDL